MRTEARPMGQTIRYAYDAAGNLTERTDPLNQRQVHTYDDANRRIRTEAFAAGAGTASRTITFTFDPRGLLTGYDDGTTSATYAYDANGRRSSESVNFGSFTRTVGLSHTPNGRLAGISYPDGASVVYRYDGAGRLNELEHPGGVMRYSAYQWQRATRVELPGNLVRREAFDALQRSTRIEVGTTAEPTLVMDHRYTYSAVGNISQKATRDGPTSYTYDALDRLTQATPPATSGLPVEGYTYDAVHNLQSSAHQPGPWSYNGNHELIQWGEGANATSLEYDANGNLVRETRGSTVRTYRYDLFDRLIEVRDNEQPIARYAWDPFARRVKKEVITGATSTTTWTLSIQRGVIAEYDASGTLMQDWQWEPDAPWSTGPIAQRTRENGELRSHQIHTDHLWTPVALTDAQGTVAWRAIKEAFGAPIVEAGATVSTPWRFPGQYADPETGLSWNLWRHYDPRTGRYTQSDPIGVADGPNQYLYVRVNPIASNDPLGLFGVPGMWPLPVPVPAPRPEDECECIDKPKKINMWGALGASGEYALGYGHSVAYNAMTNFSTGEVCFTKTFCRAFLLGGGATAQGQIGIQFGVPCGRDLRGNETCFVAEGAYFKGIGGDLCANLDGAGGSTPIRPTARGAIQGGFSAMIGVRRCEVKVLSCVNSPCYCD